MVEEVKLSSNFVKKVQCQSMVIRTLEELYQCKHIATRGRHYYFKSKKRNVPNHNHVTWNWNGKEVRTDFNLLVKMDFDELDIKIIKDDFKNYYEFEDGELDEKFIIDVYNECMTL